MLLSKVSYKSWMLQDSNVSLKSYCHEKSTHTQHACFTWLGSTGNGNSWILTQKLVLPVERTPCEKQAILEANRYCKFLLPTKEKGLIVTDREQLNTSLTVFFGEAYKMTYILYKESKSIVFNGDLYGTYFSRQKNSSLVVIQNRTPTQEIVQYPCFIVNFVKCTVELSNSSNVELVMCKLFPLEGSLHRHYYTKPVEVWKMPYTDSFHEPNSFIFLPLSCILCRCAYSVFVNDSSCVTVVPCNRYAGLIWIKSFPRYTLRAVFSRDIHVILKPAELARNGRGERET